MKDLLDQILFRTLGSIRRPPETSQQAPVRSNAYVMETLEQIIEGTDPGIRFIRGYRKKLRPGVEMSLEYTEALVKEIPPPIEVSKKTFVSDPYVNAFFANVQDLQTVFSRSSEMRDFVEDYQYHELSCCCALLCMRKSEKTILGMALEGEMLRSDVQQTTVSFADHRIYSPAPNEVLTRAGLRQCLVQGLLTSALARIMQVKLMNHDLQHTRQMLQARLRRMQRKTGETGEQTEVQHTTAREVEEIRQELNKVEEEFVKAQAPTPQVSLEQVDSVFRHPDEFIRIRKSLLTLNRMGIKVDDHSTQSSNKIYLAEAVIGEEPPRVVTLATFPKDELLPQHEYGAHKLFS